MNIFSTIFISALLLCLAESFKSNVIPDLSNLGRNLSNGKKLSACDTCRKLVGSFLKAVEETARISFEGGDAAWEKEKLGKYENSELRFIEIQERVCADVEQGKEQCYNLAEIHEPELEEWFHRKRLQNVNLFEFLCINHLSICCPDNTYGPNCIPCPGGVDYPCSGHGVCKNGGTRQKPASCLCDAGYTGNLCDSCKRGYYQDTLSSTFLCKLCDKACRDHCRGPGPKNCEVCSTGYHFIPDQGCVEVVENSDNSTQSSDQVQNDTEETNSKIDSKELDDVPVDKGHTAEHSEF